MMTQNVKAQAINLFSDTKSKSSAVKQKNSNNDFGGVMDSNLKSKSTTKKTDSTVDKSGNSTNSNQKAVNNSKTVNDSKSSVNNQKDESVNKTVKDNTETSSTDDNTVKSETQIVDSNKDEDLTNIYNDIQNLLAMLQNKVQSNLGISKEELEKAMESLGLAAVDLLNPDNLKQLVLQVNGANDISDALTDENLTNTMKQLIEAVDELKSGQDFTISAEELSEYIDKFTKTDSIGTPVVTSNTAAEIQNADLNDSVSTTADEPNDITIEIHKVQETETKDSEAFSKNSQNEDKDVTTPLPIDVFVQNMAVKGNDTSLNFTEQIANVRQMQEITNQIVDQIKIMIKPDQTSMELQLNPESLGKINLSVVAKDGIMTAHFTAQSEMAKEAIESQMQVLKDNLNNQGLKVESIEVTVSDFSFEQSNQASAGNENGQQNRSRNRNLNAVDTDIYSDSGEENQDSELLEQTGSSIDYTA